ncbi:MAG: hypothetical protein QXS02_01210 [Candidatus Thermoplasmatota archaeon]
MLMIVGQISSPEEAKEIEFITKSFVVALHTHTLVKKINKTN